MQVRLNQLTRHLDGPLAPLYLISGDEPLLVEEACSAVLAAAVRDGFAERNVIDGSAGISWNEVFADASNLSLFAEKRLLDVRVPVSKGFDAAASRALRAYLDAPLADTLVLIRTGRLEYAKRSSAWFKAIEKNGAVVLVWPIDARDFPDWLNARCATAGLALSRDALFVLVDRVEGNLLAAVQEIEKLKLMSLRQPVEADALKSAVGDASRFDTFELLDAAFGGKPPRVRKMLRGLRQEGVPVYMIMGAVNFQLRTAVQLASGMRPRMAQERVRLLEGAVARLSVAVLESVIAESARLDLQAKGMLRGDAWISLERLLLRLAGYPAARLDDEVEYLMLGR